jgi:predicted lysophospholipase L1 biosynthesis ABC-type transport system permease subunit
MVYVGAQIVIWIVIATLFGFAVGWLIRGRRGMRTSRKRRF